MHVGFTCSKVCCGETDSKGNNLPISDCEKRVGVATAIADVIILLLGAILGISGLASVIPGLPVAVSILLLNTSALVAITWAAMCGISEGKSLKMTKRLFKEVFSPPQTPSN